MSFLSASESVGVVANQPKPKNSASWLINGPTCDGPQLFNLKEDPAEQKDLAKDHPEIVKDLTDAYKAWESHHGEWGYGEPGKY